MNTSTYVGEGTEKIEQKFAELFPGARVARLDRDVARRRSEFLRVLSDFRKGKIDILVGTQLIAKGHDFPGVTLVGVVSADIGLGLPDFRAAERTFQLLTQVAGRAGRGDAPGRVLVQTFFPDHYAIRLAADQNYGGFFSKEMGFRRMMHYPPITALANVVAQHEKLERAAQVAKEIGEFFTKVEGQFPGIKILGPGTCSPGQSGAALSNPVPAEIGFTRPSSCTAETTCRPLRAVGNPTARGDDRCGPCQHHVGPTLLIVPQRLLPPYRCLTAAEHRSAHDQGRASS